MFGVLDELYRQALEAFPGHSWRIEIKNFRGAVVTLNVFPAAARPAVIGYTWSAVEWDQMIADDPQVVYEEGIKVLQRKIEEAEDGQ